MIVKRKYTPIEKIVSETFTHEKSILAAKEFWHAQEIPHFIADGFFVEDAGSTEPEEIISCLKEECFRAVLSDVSGLPTLHQMPGSGIEKYGMLTGTSFKNHISHPGTLWSRIMVEVALTDCEVGGEFEVLRDDGVATELVYRVPMAKGRVVVTYLRPDVLYGRRPVEKGTLEVVRALYATHEPPEWRDQDIRPITVKREPDE